MRKIFMLRRYDTLGRITLPKTVRMLFGIEKGKAGEIECYLDDADNLVVINPLHCFEKELKRIIDNDNLTEQDRLKLINDKIIARIGVHHNVTNKDA